MVIGFGRPKVAVEMTSSSALPQGPRHQLGRDETHNDELRRSHDMAKRACPTTPLSDGR